jgi:sulfoquinovose isomerase
MNWLASPAHHRWLEQETDRLLAFSRAARHPAGGFAWLDAAGRPQLDRPVELWITCRMTHVFALGHLMGRPGCGPLVDHGVQALTSVFRDPKYSGWYAKVSNGDPVARDKAAYEHAFVLLAATSATVAGRPGASALLEDALDVVLTRFWDDEHGMVAEQWDETFTDLEDYRGVNANMHTVEALLAAADVTGDRSLLERALRIVSRVVHDLGRGHHLRLPEHFDTSWTPLLEYNREAPAHPFRPYGATIGHGLEWSRLALHLRAALGEAEAPAWLVDDAAALFDASVRDGWSVDGNPGFVYTIDWEGRPVVRKRMHWVVAEATATAAALWSATGDAAYADWYQVWWDYIGRFVADHRLGSWWHELDEDNLPSGTVWNGKPDTYHAVQATLVPRLPLAPTFATALRDGALD